MSSTAFNKYQGTGNDFIILTDVEVDTPLIQKLCDRKFGIGADGLIVMHPGDGNSFSMMYYNADGSESFCGNGSRCSVMHAHRLGWINHECTFSSNDGKHEAFIQGDVVHLKMHDVNTILTKADDFEINTGSPHYLTFADSLDWDIIKPAQAIRYSEPYKDEGINVNFIKSEEDHLSIRTYERGVEDETLSCGTGVTAAVIAEYNKLNTQDNQYIRKVKTKGGELSVSFTKTENGFENIYLIGPAVHVFQGQIEL